MTGHLDRCALLLVDSNFAFFRDSIDHSTYFASLSRSLLLAVCARPMHVLIPAPHLFENPIAALLFEQNRLLFETGILRLATRPGVTYSALREQRLGGRYRDYPPAMLRGYRRDEIAKLAERLGPPLWLRTSSMTAAMSDRMLEAIGTSAPGTLGSQLSKLAQSHDAPPRKSIEEWLRRFARSVDARGLPFLFDVLAKTPGAPEGPSLEIIKNVMLEEYFSELEQAHRARAVSRLLAPYPRSWASSTSMEFDQLLYERVLYQLGILPLLEVATSSGMGDSILRWQHHWDEIANAFRVACMKSETSEDVIRLFGPAQIGVWAPGLPQLLAELISGLSAPEPRPGTRAGSLALGELMTLPPHLHHLRSDVLRLMSDHEFERTVFVMMKFEDPRLPDAANELLRAIFECVRVELSRHGLIALRADGKTYSSSGLLWDNLCIHMVGCGYGLAVLEDKTVSEFNPNVALEYGFMRGIGKQVGLLIEEDFRAMRADLGGMVPRPFRVVGTTLDAGSLRRAVRDWLKDAELA